MSGSAADAAGRTRAPGPRTILEIVADGAARAPEAPAILAPGRPALTYGALHDQVVATGQMLRAAGIGPDDTVALVTENGPDSAAAFLAIGSAAVCAPLNPAYKIRELDFYLGDLDAAILVVQSGLATDAREAAQVRGIPVLELMPEPEAPAGCYSLHATVAAAEADIRPVETGAALALHTSGTTSRPKLVRLSHRNLCASARAVSATLELDGTDRCLNVMPLFHIHGLVAALLASLYSNGSVACAPGFNALRFFGWLEELEPTWYTAVPTIHQNVLARLREHPDALGSHRLRFVRSSSAALPVPVLHGLEEITGIPVIEAYGMTEAAHQMASNPLPPGTRKPGSVGPAAGPQITILDEDGGMLDCGEVGEVAIRGENVFGGYAGDPVASAAAFADGWFRTGDLGFLDENAHLHLHGRLKEIINRGGEKISPLEVDDVLLLHPTVAQAVTFGVADARLGEEVAAAVVLRSGASADERALQDFVAQTIAPFKVPRTIVFLDEIPTGATGKVQRIGMGERLGLGARAPDGGGPATGYVAPRSHREHAIAEIWRDVLDVPRVGATDDFYLLGGDSIRAAEAVARIRELFGMPGLPLVSIVRAPTPAGMVAELDAPDDAATAVVPLRAGGPRRPLFLTHGGESIVGLPALALRLGEERPVYGLQPRGEHEADSWSFESIAADVVPEIKLVQPRGPYLLAGICSGGPVMLEVARLLVAGGDEVGLLALIDPNVRQRRSLRYLSWRVWVNARNGRLLESLGRRFGRNTTAPPSASQPVPAFYEQLSAAQAAYLPRPVTDVHAALLASDDYEVTFTVAPWTWGAALPGGFARRRIPGPHHALMSSPMIDTLASELRSLAEVYDAEGHDPD